MNYWHIQLHTLEEKDSVTIDEILERVKAGYIGFGVPNCDGIYFNTIPFNKENQEKFKTCIQKLNKEKQSKEYAHYINYVDYLVNQMKIGDYVVVRKGKKIIALVKVIGDYEHSEPKDKIWFWHKRPIVCLVNFKEDIEFEKYEINDVRQTLKIAKSGETRNVIERIIKEYKKNLWRKIKNKIQNTHFNKKQFIEYLYDFAIKLLEDLNYTNIFKPEKKHSDEILEIRLSKKENVPYLSLTFQYDEEREEFWFNLLVENIDYNLGLKNINDDLFFQENTIFLLSKKDSYVSTEYFKNITYEILKEKFKMAITILENTTPFLLLVNHKNLILHGAPGTGKTYLAKELAKILTNGDEGRIGFVQFHPSYDYTDFIEGLKPSEDKDKMFELKNGTFREFCKKAKGDSNNNYVFIIDEINRGDISKIFGEVFYSIEPGYRGEKGAIETQYSYLRNKENEDSFGKKFYVPENVYIIGTMNDIDRSVETFDFAIRRRFVWYEVKVQENGELTTEAKQIFEELKRRLLKNEKIENEKNDKILEDAKKRLINLNEKLESEAIGLDSTYHIGPAYFLNLDKYNGDFGQLWNYHLKPLLLEYVRTLDDHEGKLVQLENAYNEAK